MFLMKFFFGIYSCNYEFFGSVGFIVSGIDYSWSNFLLIFWVMIIVGFKIVSEVMFLVLKVGFCGLLIGDYVGLEVLMDEMMIWFCKESFVIKEVWFDCE